MKRLRLIVLLMITGSWYARAQADGLTARDTMNINRHAINTVSSLSDFLNFISTHYEEGDINATLKNAFSVNKLFSDSTAIIESNLLPEYGLGNSAVLAIPKYVKDFNILYEKSDTSSVSIIIKQILPVRKGASYKYLQVICQETFVNKYKPTGESYSPATIVIELKIEKPVRTWETTITRIAFFDPDKYNKDTLNNIPVLLAGDNLQETDWQEDPTDYNLTLSRGNAFYDIHDFTSAYLEYRQARLQRPYAAEPLRKMQKIREVIKSNGDDANEYLYEQLVSRALMCERRSSFGKAVGYLDLAKEVLPDSAIVLDRSAERINARAQRINILSEQYRLGQFRDAIGVYDDAIKQSPQNGDYYLLRGEALERLGNLKKALTDYNASLQYDATNLAALLKRGKLHSKRKEYLEANLDYDQYIAIDNQDPEAYIQKALNYEVNNNTAEALVELDRAIKILPNAASLYYAGADILFRKGAYTAALGKYEQTILRDPDHDQGRAFLKQGLCFLELADVGHAGAAFQQALSHGIDRAGVALINGKAEAYRVHFLEMLSLVRQNASKANIDSALVTIDNALKIMPASPLSHYLKGMLYHTIGNYRGAVDGYSKALTYDRNYAPAYYQRGAIYLLLQQNEDAATDLSQVLQINAQASADSPDELALYCDAVHLKAQARYNQGRFADAIMDCNNTLSRIGTERLAIDRHHEAMIRSVLAKAYYAARRTIEAQAQVDKTLDLDKNYAEAYYTRGLIRKDQHSYDDAVRDLFKALESDRNNPVWNYALGEVFRLNDNYAEGRKAYNVCCRYDTLLNYPMAFYYRGYCSGQMGSYVEALTDYLAAKDLHLDEKTGTFYTELGDVYLNLNRFDSAAAQYTIAYSRNNADAGACYGLGKACYFQNRSNEAQGWMEKAFAGRSISRSRIKSDKMIANMREEQWFKKLMKKYY
ncbi:tetratricopeptide repeat protein [Taibaiella koreensis]|uniref:tetratricopeptide repeat protein n=1 Tax=Taibaiella koreensis TaxID=1268548 RepID=UPI000E599497|nr:tetratricopeptide repeat protein [Taibaiella koreensis]